MRRLVILIAFSALLLISASLLLSACNTNSIPQMPPLDTTDDATKTPAAPDNTLQTPATDTPDTTPQTPAPTTPEVLLYLFGLPELPGFTMKTEFEIYPTNVDEIVTLWKNESPYDVTNGEFFVLVKKEKEGDMWILVEDILGTPFPSIVTGSCYSGTEREKTYSLSRRYGILNTGDYRVYTRIYTNYDEKTRCYAAIYAEFSISENA